MILVLEDLDDRYAAIRSGLLEHRVPEPKIVRARTAAEATTAIGRGGIKVALIDHDLDQDGSVPISRTGTGIEVANAIVTFPKARRPYAVIVHSRNSVAAVTIVTKMLLEASCRVAWIPTPHPKHAAELSHQIDIATLTAAEWWRQATSDDKWAR